MLIKTRLFLSFTNILLAALAYFLAGKYGLMLAIPPGFASAVWPASGVALAAMLLYPKVSTCIGIGMGSFALNLGVAAGGYSNITFDMLTLPSCIAMGASLQACAGYWLFHRLAIKTTFDSPASILNFTLITSPISCLIAPTFGAGSLFQLGLIDDNNLSFTWSTWWAGDTIGTLLFAPMLIILFDPQKHFSSTRKWQIAIPTAAIFSGITLLFYLSSANQHQAIQHDLSEAAQDFAQDLNKRLIVSENKLLAYRAFFNSSSDISAKDFEVFSQFILKDDDVFQGIGWTPIVSPAKRPLFEALGKKDISPDFTFTELNANGEIVIATEQATYYPIFYIFPLAENRKALGLNLASLPQRLSLLLRAAESSVPLATGPIKLVQGSKEQKGIILYLPILLAPPLSTTSPETSVPGFISGVFQMQGLLHSLVEQAKSKNHGITLIDVTEADHPSTLFETDKAAQPGFIPETLPLSFGGRKLELTLFADMEYRLSSKDWTSWSILTFGFLLAALFQAFILLITGTTENIKLEVYRQTLELKQAKTSAEKANKAKTNFLNNMSHELRTPLNAVMGFINLTLKTPLSEIQKSHLEKAQLASSTLMSLINHTLDYAKIEAGRIELEKINFSLEKIVEKVSVIFSSQAEGKGIFFQLISDQNIPRQLKGDPLRLEQILLNLCSNAVKFTQSGGVTLKISSETIDEKNIALNIKVIDSGIGISEEQQAKLFNAFSQADSGTKRIYGGTGLGLSICKKLVEAMDGSIALKSTKNIGTQIDVQLCFEISFDKFLDENIDDAGSNTATYEKASQEPLSGTNVLIVEDIPINQELATYILEDFGAHVFIANNGQEALDFLKGNKKIDVILMDLQMPVMDGIEATKRIIANADTSHIPIIAMTANAISTDIDACVEAGMLDHIAKPIDEVDLLEKLTKHCKTKNK